MKKIINYSERNKRKQFEKRSEGSLIALHCGGIRLKDMDAIPCKEGNLILVPFVNMKSAESIRLVVSTASWKVVVGSMPADRSIPVVDVQCKSCWIGMYRLSVAKSGGDIDELYKKIDPEGKFWDEMRAPIQLEISSAQEKKEETTKEV